MENEIYILYTAAAVMLSLFNFIFGGISFFHKKRASRLLGYSGVFAGSGCILYSLSAFLHNSFVSSLFASVYYASVDIVLLCILGFTFLLDNQSFSKTESIIFKVFNIYAVFDVSVFMLSAFHSIAIDYMSSSSKFSVFLNEWHGFFAMHLIFTYLSVFMILFCLVKKAIRVPYEYRSPYIFNFTGVLAVSWINILYLFSGKGTLLNRINLAPLVLSITYLILYWSYYEYSSHGMLNKLKTAVFENIDKGIVLFDYNNFLILHNKKAGQLLGKESFSSDMTLEKFNESNKLILKDTEASNCSFQCYVGEKGYDIPLRCDYKVLKNYKGSLLGRLMIFSDIALETDILTGFHNWESFKVFAKKNPEQFSVPISVAILDINALSIINSSFGRNEGDKKIKELSDIMRKHFPENTYFVREHEAHLVALCRECLESEIRVYVEESEKEFSGRFQFALNTTTVENPDIVSSIREASKAMKTKKLLDDSSSHSELIATLVKALKECDNDTEQHVRRTREMGARLGKRIGLSDIQMSNLSLLCLLHDIGKIGIPLEILNKPGRLNEEEWVVMRSHTEKGYQIAASAKELELIAEMVLHHHERWDGMGYPDGLSRENIPILSRVIAVIDSYDAMVNDRVYRPGMSVDDALAELQKCAGSHFDPNIVAEFVSMIREEPEKEQKELSKGASAEESAKKSISDTIYKVIHSRYIVNEDWRIIEADDMFEKFTGYSRDYIKNNHLSQLDLIPETDRLNYFYAVNEQMANAPRVFFEHNLKKKNGDVILVLCLGDMTINKKTGKNLISITISNIMHTQTVKTLLKTEQEKAQKRLGQWEARYRSDSLTGLMNRLAFGSDVEAKLLTGASKVMMIMISFDSFSEHNENSVKDDFIVHASQNISSLVREGDLACRMGGDEFAIALFFKNDQASDKIYSRARAMFEDLSGKMKGTDGYKGVCMGAAISSEQLCTFGLLYDNAEKMLNKARAEGCNRICCDE